MNEAICAKCGDKYTLNKRYSKAQIARSKFCSRKCQYKGKATRGGGWNKGKRTPWKKDKDKVTPLQEQIRDLFEYREWRSKIFNRDGFTCVLCDEKGGKLNADHYPKSFRQIFYKFNIKTLPEALKCKDFWRIKNGRTLCENCHRKTDNFGHKAKKHG